MSLTKIRARFAVTLPRITMFLLVGAGLATSVVVYQAYQAQRSHEETVARALAEYGAFALWEFSERLPNAIFNSLAPAYRPVMVGLGPDRRGPPSLEEFARGALRQDVPCRCTSAIVAVFRFDVRNDVFEVQGRMPDGLERWVRDTLRSHRADFPMGGLRFSRAPSGPARSPRCRGPGARRFPQPVSGRGGRALVRGGTRRLRRTAPRVRVGVATGAAPRTHHRTRCWTAGAFCLPR